MTGTAITPIGPFDAALLAALHEICFREPWDRRWDERSFTEILAMPGIFGSILSEAGPGKQPFGFVLGLAAADEAEILLIGIAPDRRGAGHGTALLSRFIVEARQLSVIRLILEVADENKAAQALYRALGFQQVGLRPRYYRTQSNTVDALILALDLQIQ